MTLQAIKDRWMERREGAVDTAAWAARAPLIVTVALVMMAAWLVARLFWLLIVGPEVNHSTLGSRDLADQAERSVPAGASHNVDWTLFGGQTRARATDVARLPVDESRLSLVGVVYTKDPQSPSDSTGYALIRGVSSRDGMFRVGETLPDGRTIEQIEPTAVVLGGPQGRRVLMLHEREAQDHSDASASTPATRASRVEELDWTQGVGVASVSGLPSESPLDSVAVQRGGVAMMAVPSGGFRLRPGPEAEWFARAGLQINDVLVAINGQPVGSQLPSGGDLTDWVTQIASGERMTLTVDRNGQRVTIEPSAEGLRQMLEPTGG